VNSIINPTFLVLLQNFVFSLPVDLTSIKRLSYTIHGIFVIDHDFIVTPFGAIFSNIIEANLVYRFHVIPPELRATFFLKFLSETGLSEVLKDNIFSLDIALQ
jgi:hypothetical protein